MAISSTFLSLSVCIALPLAIVALIFHLKKLKPVRLYLLIINFLAFGLTIGGLVNSILGLALSEEAYFYSNPSSNYYGYEPEDIHPCAWVALGLTIGAMAVGILVLLLTLGCIRRARRASREEIELQRQRERDTERYVNSLVKKNQSERVPEPKPQPKPAGSTNHSMDYIDEIRRLKELLDCGAITQEEFDTKKKQLLSI